MESLNSLKKEVAGLDAIEGMIGGHAIITDGEIPKNTMIACPRKGFKTRSASNVCPTCVRFAGLLEVSPGAVEFKHRYKILCAFPIARTLDSLED